MERRVGHREWNEALNEDRYSLRDRIEREQWSALHAVHDHEWFSERFVAPLEQLSASDGVCRSKSSPLIDRMLTTIAERIERTPLPALKPALEWVNSNAARFRSGPDSVLHLDYLPRNVLVDGLHVSGVTDWLDVDVGDRHLDVATTSVILRTSATGHHGLLRDHAVGNTLRALCAATYVTLYHSILPLDLERLRYYQVVAALYRLAMFSLMRARGAGAIVGELWSNQGGGYKHL
jgi:aminoglycoside phosphotransferase (APT) family kinase protein